MSKPKTIQAFLSLALPLLVGNALVAQAIREQAFVQYTAQQGLSHNMITGMAQDSIGYIWISTSSGINRFDGNRFLPFHSTKDSASLPAESVTGMAALDTRRLGFYAQGLHVINTVTGERRNLIVPYEDKRYQYKLNMIVKATGNENGDVFILTGSGFYHFNESSRLVFRYDHHTDEKIRSSLLRFGRALHWIDDRQLLIVAFSGLFRYDIETRALVRMKRGDVPLLDMLLTSSMMPYQVCQPRRGCFVLLKPGSDSLVYIDLQKQQRIFSKRMAPLAKDEFGFHSKFVAASDSVFYITGQLNGFFRIHLDQASGRLHFDTTRYFRSYYCKDLLHDHEGRLWVATSKGLFREDQTWTCVRTAAPPPAVEDVFPSIAIEDMCTAGDRLYVGTRGTCGLLVYDKHTLRFIERVGMGKYTDTAKSLYSIVPLTNERLLIGSSGPLLDYNVHTHALKPVALEHFVDSADWVSGIYKDRKGNVWLGGGGIYRYDFAKKACVLQARKQLLGNRLQVPSLFQDDAWGNIWIGGYGFGKYDPAANRFEALTDSLPYIRMPDRLITALAADKHDRLWMGRYNNGLIGYDIHKKSFLHFTRDNGLPDNNVISLIVVGDKLWLACYSGIACLDLVTYKIMRFGKEDGFPDLPVVQGSEFAYDSSLHRIYIGFSNTVASFNPDSLLRKMPEPRFFIEQVALGSQQHLFLPPLSLVTNWRHNDVTVTMGAINFSGGGSQRFAYRILRGEASEWHQLGALNEFSLSNLSPGRYRIQVKMFSIDNRWPEQVQELDIRIRRQFWKRSWFLSVWAALLAISVYLFMRWRIRVARAKEQEKTRIQKLIAEDYKNQFELEQINNYFSSSLADKKEVNEVLWDVMHNLISRLNYKDCMIYLWNESKTRMVQKAAFGPKGNPEAIRRQVFDVLPGQGVVGYVMQTREPLLIPDTRKDPRYRMDEMMRLSEICVPIIHNDELIGIIDSEHPELNYYKARDLKILTTIATLIGNKIKQIESEQSLESKQEEIASINQQLAEAQLSALQAQMNPHFIFNALNSIKRMILDNQRQEASRYLSKFAHMIRLTLNQSKEIFATLQENLEYLESYLEMEKLRFGETFTWRMEVDEQLDEEDVLIPTLMIQPLVENAIWHGLMHRAGEKQLLIRFSKEQHGIVCTIEDNGIGIRKSEQMKQPQNGVHKSVGLENLRHRIRILNEKYKTHCSLQITDRQEQGGYEPGTRVVLRFDRFPNKF